MAEHEEKTEKLEEPSYTTIPSSGKTLSEVAKDIVQHAYSEAISRNKIEHTTSDMIEDLQQEVINAFMSKTEDTASQSSEISIVIDVALAQVEHDRTLMMKDRQEIERLGTETRAIILKLLAA